MNELPFFAIENDQLEKLSEVGRLAICPNCKKKHVVKYGTSNGKESKLLGFVNCGKDAFLVAVNGKAL